MKALCLIIMFLIPSFCQAWYAVAVLVRSDIDGWVRYDYQVGVEANDPAWQTLKANHHGKKDGNIQHANHTNFIPVLVLPWVMTHPSPKAQYNLSFGTHEYCAVLTPNSELIDSSNPSEEDQVLIALPACDDICWDLCPSC